MKLPKPRRESLSLSHEEIFAQRYRWLMGWALRLTNHDREQAEDLVHDTFVQFMISQTDLATIESIEGYLYGMLRNLHISQVRRALRLRETAFPIADILSISETASVQNELRVAGQKLQVQDELCRICQYASIRKHSSKVGSVVILRFFHGYYPNEIAAVTRSSRAGVDKMLQRARTEARLYLKDPASLSFLNGEQGAPELQITFGKEPEDLLCELREALYRSRQGECLSASQLRETYQAKETDRVSPAILAHIVCCAVCLDEVNRLLGLPLLAEREPEKMTGRDKRNKGDGGSDDGSGATGDFMEKPRRRLKQVLEHRPKELRVSVNGFILGSHAINSELNKLSISAKGEEKVGFVEVFSEEEVRLLFCVVEPPPDGPVEQTAKAQLSDRRSLELSLDFSDSWPALDVTYRDPTFTADANALSAESSIESESPVLVRAEAGSDQVESQGPTSKVEGPLVRSAGILAEIRRGWSGLWTWNFGQFLRPGTVTAVVALLLIAALTFVYVRPERTPIISAANLLQQSAAAEEAIAARADQVLHRTISLEEKKVSGELISRRRVEVWHSAEKGITARRLYDENGSLIAGDWRRADGVQTIYHHGKRPELRLDSLKGGNTPINFDSVWQLDPTARQFTSLVGDPQNARAQVTDNGYVISYADSNAPALVSASLVLGRDELRAFEQTLVVRQAGEVREYRFTEISFERRRSDSVAPAVFEPEVELLSSSTPETSNLKPETASPLALGPSPVMATAALEVDVIEALNSAGAFVSGEQLSVSRAADGKIQINALVETDQRKRDLLAALANYRSNPAVRIGIQTVAEAEARAKKRGEAQTISPTSIDQFAVTERVSPVFAELKKKFSEEEARRYSERVLAKSRQAWLHAAAMKQLSQRFSTADLVSLSPSERSRWLGLIRGHAGSFLREAETLRRELAQVFPEAAAGAGAAGSIGSDSELQGRVRQLYDAAVTIDRGMNTSFGVGSSGAAPVRGAAFWNSFSRAMGLARSLQSVK